MERAFTHTPGPWETPGTDDGEYIICASPKGRRRTLAHVHEQANLGIYTQSNARRIVACVNACEGMNDPAAFIVSVRKSNEDRYAQIVELRSENQRLKKALEMIRDSELWEPAEGAFVCDFYTLQSVAGAALRATE